MGETPAGSSHAAADGRYDYGGLDVVETRCSSQGSSRRQAEEDTEDLGRGVRPGAASRALAADGRGGYAITLERPLRQPC
ncbi:hypothetical protein TNCT_247121 [Trichonephila clavata]|uniref:Uncharacterized protein n=1 Tax=Trichonephila clavata TaxID=2740835 RepID=A0A8X6G6N7_TRICU|nr:hypothetical protein TNCT_247121 [Trichonephila clavata]